MDIAIDKCDVDWESIIVERVFDRIAFVPTPEEYSDCVEAVQKILLDLI